MSRALADAAIAGALLALAIDLLLQGALAAVRIDSGSSSWLAATLFDGARWVVAAVLLRLVASRASTGEPGSDPMDRSAAFAVVGRAMMIAPFVWTVASIIVRAVRISIDGGWQYEGRVFLGSDFYGELVAGYAPWALGGLALLAIARHAPPVDRRSATGD